MKDIEAENLSVQLFNQQKHAKETSSIIESDFSKEQKMSWYRVLQRAQWAWLGLSPLLIEETLSRIAASKNERTHSKLLDTVYGYRPGNWSYEWTQSGMSLQRGAEFYDEQQNQVKAMEQWFAASTCFSIAGYPHIKGDSLSLQSNLMANKAFQQAVQRSAFKIIEVETKLDSKQIKANLYLPNLDSTHATVMICGGIGYQQIELWRIFEHYFAPANIAILTLDMPSIGHSASIQLTENTCKIHQAMLDALRDVPWVDHDRVGCLGLRLGANAAVRMAFVEQLRVKACVSVGGMLHSIFESQQFAQHCPAMYLDSIASSFGRTRVDASLLTYLKTLSLKNQGLLAGRRTKVPILAMRLAHDDICLESDNQLVALYSSGGKSETIRSRQLHVDYDTIMQRAMLWFTEKL